MEITEIEEMKKDPVKFVEICFPKWEILDHQKELLRMAFVENTKLVAYGRRPGMNSLKAVMKCYKEFRDGYKSEGLRKTQKQRIGEIKTKAEETFDKTLNRIMRGVQGGDNGTDYY